jgi:hypothetical protein
MKQSNYWARMHLALSSADLLTLAVVRDIDELCGQRGQQGMNR